MYPDDTALFIKRCIRDIEPLKIADIIVVRIND